jgi:hypothetical protein
MNRCRNRTRAALVLAAMAAVVPGCSRPGDTVDGTRRAEAAVPGVEETKAIAEEAYIYGLPLVMNYAVMYDFAVNRNSGQFKAPFNEIANEARVFTYRDTAVIVPNSDTPYSTVSLDLRAEPMVLSVPAVDKSRYYSVQLCDGNTFNYGYIGSRATGHEPGAYLVAGPGWTGETPPGIRQVFRSSTQFSLAIFRTQLFGPEDMPNVQKVQSGYRVQPLSAFLGQPAPPAAPGVDFPPIDKSLVASHFLQFLDFALRFAPPGPEESAIRARLARIGIGAPGTVSLDDLSPEHKAAVAQGMKEGARKVSAAVDQISRKVNGWNVGSSFGDRAFYNGDWLKRAAAAQSGIYGNSAAEAVYPMARADADGQPLDGSQHAYTLTFPAGQLPPVNAFWSVTMYDGTTQLLIQNPIDRYLINSTMLPSMKKGPDGSLTIYIQKEAPEKARASNWLPAPNGPIYLVMRLYWPKTEPPSILPPGQGTWQPPAIRRADAHSAQSAPAPPAVLGDGAGAQYKRVENMHQTRFIEIFLAAREAGTGNMVAACFNTMFTSRGIPASKDTAPQALVEGLDFEKMKQDYGVLGASLNGPKLWLSDWTDIDVGKEREFNGMPAAWVAQLNMGTTTSVGETTPYKPMSIARKSAVGWNKGTKVILLDDAEGNTWIMKGFQLGLKPLHTYEEFVAAAASQFQALPQGFGRSASRPSSGT